jgi:hypothetical protein
MNRLAAVLSLWIRCWPLAGCSRSPAGPHLANIRTGCLQICKTFHVQGYINNVGSPFKGLQIELKGTAFSNSVLAMPNSIDIWLQDQWCTPVAKKTVQFVGTPSTGMKAILGGLECDEPRIAFFLAIPAIQPGNGDFTVTISPWETSAAAICYRVPCTIYQREMEQTMPNTFDMGRSLQLQATAP